MQIRKFDQQNNSEVNQVYAIQKAAYRVEAKVIGALVFPPLHGTWQELADSKDEGFVYLRDNCPAGAIFLESTEHSVLISKLIVAPEFFRSGIAKALISHSLARYPVAKFEVGTASANYPALQLYRSFGFRIFEETTAEENITICRLQRLTGTGIDVELS